MSQEPQCARFRSIFTCSPLDSIYITQWLVGCGLTSHSAIFQLYSDGTVVRFPNFDLLPGTQPHGQLGVFSVPSLPRHGHPDVWRRLLPPLLSEGPQAVRVCRESNPDCLIHCPACYLYATVVGITQCILPGFIIAAYKLTWRNQIKCIMCIKSIGEQIKMRQNLAHYGS